MTAYEPDEIDEMLRELRALWQKNPDQRLGQLVYNICRYTSGPIPACPQLFYMDEKDLRAGIKKMSERVKAKERDDG
jgi:hypothetical protein